MTNKLPQGWVECELKDLCEVISKGTTPKNQTEEPNFARFLKAENVTKESILDLTSCKYIDEETHTKILKRSILKRNDILITIAGTLGRCAIVETDENLNTNQAVCFARLLNCGINPNFIKYFILSPFVNRKLTNEAKVTAIPNLTLEIIKNINIKLPPINEQKRIVAKIEEEFGKIDEGVEKLKLAQEQIKQYRQSVLNKQFKIKNKEIVTLNDVTIKINDGTHKTPTYVEEGTPFISVKDIRNKQIYFDDCKYITKEEHEVLYKRCNPEKGDVLITKSGTIGRTAVIYTDKIFDLFVSVALLKPQKDKITSEFLMYALDNYISHIDVKQDVKGGLIKNLHIEDIKKIKINLPALDEQKQIVAEIEKRFEAADEVERVITENLDKAEQLKQSILKKAFEGRLVPQDPTDQPASELLAQIQAERNK